MFDWYYTIKRKIKQFSIYNIIYGIKNLVKWFPIIWKDRDFDEGYLYDIMYFKLGEMQKFFESDNVWCANTDECVKQLKECRMLLKRIMNDETEYECWDHDNKKFTKPLEEISKLVKEEKELFWSKMCKYVDGWWD